MEKELLIQKIKELEQYINHLRKYQKVLKEELENNLDTLWIIERGLQISTQLVLDIGNHILSHQGRAVEKYSEVFKELSRLEVIPEQFAKEITGLAGFRNILVHEYAHVDLDILLQVLQHGLDDMLRFSGYVLSYIEEE